MTELQQALAALRRDVDRAFAGDGGSGGIRPGRVSLRLGLEWVSGGGSGQDGFWRPASADACHTIELEWRAGANAADAVAGVTIGVAKPEPEVGLGLAEQLDAVFGKPGFDSAARATVFREVAVEVGAGGLPEVLDAACSGERLQEAAKERARHALARLLERGPSGVAGGCAALKRALATHGFGDVVKEVESRWQYGTGHDLGPAG